MEALSIRGVGKTFHSGFIPRRRTVLRGITLDVHAGEVFAFLGPNGAGKTTTLKAIVGLLRPSEGEVRIYGHPAGTIEANRRLGFLPENPYFYQYLRPDEFLLFHADLYGLPRSTARARAAELLRVVGLDEHVRVPLRKFSKGMIQRLGLAQAMLSQPELLILDEPLSGLDPVGRKEFRDIILEQRARGRTIFFSSHILQDAEMICNRAAILVDGEIRRAGTLEELTSGEAAGYEIALTGVRPESAAQLGEMVAIQDAVVFIRVASEVALERALSAIRADGGHVRSVVPTRQTLEDVFMKEIGKGNKVS